MSGMHLIVFKINDESGSSLWVADDSTPSTALSKLDLQPSQHFQWDISRAMSGIDPFDRFNELLEQILYLFI